MKNSNLNILKNSLTVSVVVSVLSFASCKKDDMIVAPKGPLISGTERQNTMVNGTSAIADASDAAQLQSAAQSVMMKIDHQAARSNAADYVITVKFDRTVIFEGRRNVAYIGIKEWQVDISKFAYLKQLFANFNSIDDKLSLAADLPMASTSWCASPKSHVKTLIDYNDNYPVSLIIIRVRAEEILNIQDLIKPASQIEFINSTK